MSAREMLAKKPKAIILSGGPSSVYESGAPTLDEELLRSGVPVFGICYGFQVMAATLGGEVGKTGAREYGRTELTVQNDSPLFNGLPKNQQVWMSHGDSVLQAPKGFTVTGSTSQTPVAAFESADRKLAGVQYHPEVVHSTYGQEVLQRRNRLSGFALKLVANGLFVDFLEEWILLLLRR
jgi:GMP synthase (glutamine-hydrolysing)